MTAWTICKGILLAVGILFVGIPLAAGYLWLFVALVLVPVLGSAALNWLLVLPLLIGSAWVWRHAGEGREP